MTTDDAAPRTFFVSFASTVCVVDERRASTLTTYSASISASDPSRSITADALFFFFLPSPSLFFSLKRRIGWIPIFGIPPPFHRPPPRLGLPSARPATPVKKLGTQNSVRDQVEPDRRRGRETRDGGVATPGVDNWIRLREGARVSTTTTTSVHFATGDEDVDGAEGRPVSSSNDDF